MDSCRRLLIRMRAGRWLRRRRKGRATRVRRRKRRLPRNELASAVADGEIGDGGRRNPDSYSGAARLLAGIFATEMEVPGGGGGGDATGAAADGARVLCAGGAGGEFAPRTMVDVADRAHACVHIRGTGDRVSAVQSAVCGAT